LKLQVDYAFNAIKNELNSRKTSSAFYNVDEQFVYDDNNRLINWTNPVTGEMEFNTYDKEGRITENNRLGKVKFEDANSPYRASSIELTKAGEKHYENDLVQKITYNENNDPLLIDGVKGDYSFGYGLNNSRQSMTFGGNFEQGKEGQFTKYYAEDMSAEVIVNNQTGEEKHLMYIGGSPYESNIVSMKDFGQDEAKFIFLHKDYLGSILAISDENGKALEYRHFDAWGLSSHIYDGSGNKLTQFAVLDRAYTSHEHLTDVGLIHMNGRLYDPILRRFLNADENIQDPENTQVYNKYGYVMNNPLMFTDPDGEFIFIPILIGAVIGAYMSGVKANNSWNPLKWDWAKTGTTIALGAVIGGVSGAAGAWAGGAAATFAASVWSVSAGSVLSGAIAGAAGGFVGGAIGGAGMAALFKENILKGAWNGAWQGFVGGAVLGAATNYIKGLGATSPNASGVGADANAIKITDPNAEVMLEFQIEEVIVTAKKGVSYTPKMLQQVESAMSNLRVTRATAVDANTGKAISNGVVEAAEVGGGNNFAYRALTSANAESLASGQGIFPKNPTGSWTLEEHLIRGSSPKSFINDPWISTSTDINVAKSFSSGNGLIRVDLSKLPINSIQQGWMTLPRLSPGYHYSIWQQEVSIFGHIPQNAIKIIK
jgi:RHS repeat-associated protein